MDAFNEAMVGEAERDRREEQKRRQRQKEDRRREVERRHTEEKRICREEERRRRDDRRREDEKKKTGQQAEKEGRGMTTDELTFTSGFNRNYVSHQTQTTRINNRSTPIQTTCPKMLSSSVQCSLLEDSLANITQKMPSILVELESQCNDEDEEYAEDYSDAGSVCSNCCTKYESDDEEDEETGDENQKEETAPFGPAIDMHDIDMDAFDEAMAREAGRDRREEQERRQRQEEDRCREVERRRREEQIRRG
ncbi:hypothetical protein ACROYT_G015084 [Oculina patagonica]